MSHIVLSFNDVNGDKMYMLSSGYCYKVHSGKKVRISVGYFNSEYMYYKLSVRKYYYE